MSYGTWLVQVVDLRNVNALAGHVRLQHCQSLNTLPSATQVVARVIGLDADIQ